MTDYNDGEWHEWNGDDRVPLGVHKESLVDALWLNESNNLAGHTQARPASWINWLNVKNFRVVEQHKEPMEWWINIYYGGITSSLYKTRKEAVANREPGCVITVNWWRSYDAVVQKGVIPMFPSIDRLKKAMLSHGVDIGPMSVDAGLSEVSRKLEELHRETNQ